MMKKSIIVIILFFVLVCCNKPESGWKGSIDVVDGVTFVKNPKEGLWDSDDGSKVTLITEKQIGMDDGPDEFLFVFLIDIAVNSKGDIYVSDRQLNEIRKFDKNGNYLSSLGRPGQGPGEFQSVSKISVNSRDEMIAFDSMMERISIFSDKGDLLETTKKLILDSWIAPKSIFYFDDRMLIFGKLNKSLKLFHVFDKDWSYMESYIDYRFVDNREFEELSISFCPGNCFLQNENIIYYTNYHYNNQILVYKDNELKKIISRDSPIKKPYEVEVFKDINKAKKKKIKGYHFRMYGQGMSFVGNHFQNSIGLFQLTNSHIVNFINIYRPDNKLELGVELYDEEGILLSYSKLGEGLFSEICCKDSNDLFYAIDRKEYHKVIVFRLEY